MPEADTGTHSTKKERPSRANRWSLTCGRRPHTSVTITRVLPRPLAAPPPPNPPATASIPRPRRSPPILCRFNATPPASLSRATVASLWKRARGRLSFTRDRRPVAQRPARPPPSRHRRQLVGACVRALPHSCHADVAVRGSLRRLGGTGGRGLDPGRSVRWRSP